MKQLRQSICKFVNDSPKEYTYAGLFTHLRQSSFLNRLKWWERSHYRYKTTPPIYRPLFGLLQSSRFYMHRSRINGQIVETANRWARETERKTVNQLYRAMTLFVIRMVFCPDWSFYGSFSEISVPRISLVLQRKKLLGFPSHQVNANASETIWY